MTRVESPEHFAFRVEAARVSMKADQRLNRPSPDWIVELVEEGDPARARGSRCRVVALTPITG